MLHDMSLLGIAKRVESNGPVRQPVLKWTSWVENFNPSVRFGPFYPARQLDELKYGSTRPGPLAI